MKILVVEDDFSSQHLLKRYLSVYGEVVTADDGKVAIEEFQKALEGGESFNLVCLDIMLPELSGQEVLQHIRNLEESKGILGLAGSKVIMLTAMRDSENIMKAFRSQCEAYITKPLNKDKLFSEMKSLGLISEIL